MTLKLVTSNDEVGEVVLGEVAVIFTSNGVYFTCNEYVKKNPALVAGYLQKLTFKVTNLIPDP